MTNPRTLCRYLILLSTLLVLLSSCSSTPANPPTLEQRVVMSLEDYFTEGPGASTPVTSLQLYGRLNGKLVAEATIKHNAGWRELLSDGIAALEGKAFGELTLCFGYNYTLTPMPLKSPSSYQTAIGVKGVEFHYEDKSINYCGLKAISLNQAPWRILTHFAKTINVSLSQLNTTDIPFYTYDNHQFYFDMATNTATPLYRGNELVSYDDISQSSVQAMSERLARWLLNNTNENTGETTYKFWPSPNTFSTSNNMIRQFMASYAMQVWANTTQAPPASELAHKNLQFNLNTYYKTDGDIGYIEYSRKRKLGAAGLAALSILTSTRANEFSVPFDGLVKAIDEQWQPNGAFRTFIRQERNDLHNFYPGEAMFFWAHWLEKQPDDARLQQFLTSAHYYMDWHFANRNPAFVPWHTQAYYKVWQQTGDAFLQSSIFTMNDWLIEKLQLMEERDGFDYPDFAGRFYYPKGGYGPPHASATGVYLEGLADAWALAKAINDTQRQEAYRQAIIKGIRHAMQLEFANDIDMYYVRNKKAALGGLRSRVYDNEIRMDNVQHNLLALLKILQRFDEADYSLSVR
ncbi:hypothetical protein [Alteromonas sp. AMM-1]|uniref:hypothetical protein n=1 Tax=Alteromonas sp. AMM-1 TaxID=3394233 RepID=UPI0039A65B66